MENEEKKYCYRYPHPAVTTDCVIFTFHDRKLKVLLIKRGIEPFKGRWALPGGFMRIDESAEQGALRELLEETGYRAAYIRQFHTFSAPDRDPRERVVTVAFLALVKWAEVCGGDDADEAAWTDVDALPELAFDHAEILQMALESLRREIHFNPVGFDLLDSEFSMRDLQEVYEAILGREFDRRNFAKKMRHTGVIEPVDAAPPLPQDTGYHAQPARDDDDCVCAEPSMSIRPESPKATRPRRLSSLFRFNRDRYEKLKGDDSFEF